MDLLFKCIFKYFLSFHFYFHEFHNFLSLLGDVCVFCTGVIFLEVISINSFDFAKEYVVLLFEFGSGLV